MARMYEDLTGARFGMLVAIRPNPGVMKMYPGETHMFWDCRCDCGNWTTVRSNQLKKKATRSCGCVRIEWCRELGRSNLSKQKPRRRKNNDGVGTDMGVRGIAGGKRVPRIVLHEDDALGELLEEAIQGSDSPD